MRTFAEFVQEKENGLNEMDAPPADAMVHGAPTAQVAQAVAPVSGPLKFATPEEQEMYKKLKTPEQRLEFIKYIRDKRQRTPEESKEILQGILGALNQK